MGTTYLTLVNTALNDINEVELTETNFSSAKGIQKHAKNAVNYALREIHNKEFQWPFNAIEHTQVLAAGTYEYGWPLSFKNVDWNSFQIQKDDDLNVESKTLRILERDDWYQLYRDLDDDAGSNGRNVPDYVFKTHGNGYGITPSPNEAYSLKYRYYSAFQALVDYNDETTVPTEYDHVINYGALKHMNYFLDNIEMAQIIDKNQFRPALDQMRTALINDEQYMRSTQINRYGTRQSGVTI